MASLTLIEAIATPHLQGCVIARSFQDSEYRLRFYSLFDAIASNPSSDPLIQYGDWARFKALYDRAIDRPSLIMNGLFHLDDYIFLENDALAVNLQRHEALIGQPLGWGRDYAEWYIRDHGLNPVIDGSSDGLSLREKLKRPMLKPMPKAIILSSPGHDIYGHWLIDMLPRLAMLNHLYLHDVPILLNFVPQWAEFFLDAMGISRGRIRPHPMRAFKVECAMVPSMSKSGQTLAPRLTNEAWALVSEYHAKYGPEVAPSPKVFLSRSRWSLRERETLDRGVIDKMMAARGFRVVHPQEHSVAEQISIMKSARLVIGEDGSALHNIAFSRAGATLGVLSPPGRDNLYHMGICKIRKHKVGYCQISENWAVPKLLRHLNNFIDTLEDRADV